MSETMIDTCVLTLGELMSKDSKNFSNKVKLQSFLNGAEGKKYKLVIPFYQRAYVWSEEMVKIMLEDIDEQRKENEKIKADNKNKGDNKDKQNEKRYLLGSLIIHIENKSNQKAEFNIVDGQQRLTTLDLILDHLGDKLDLEKEQKISSESNTEQTIKQTIKNWFENRDKNSFLEYLKGSIEFVCVFTNSLDDAFIFFDSANAKGKRLEGYDLIKAFHLRALEDYNPKAQAKDSKSSLTAYFAKEFEKLATDSETLKILFNETLTPARQWLRHNSDKVSYQMDIYGEFCAEIPQRFKTQPLIAKDSLGILQNFVGGADFFEYLSHFHRLYERLCSVEFYTKLTEIDGRGFEYNRYIYTIAVLIYFDKFPNGRVDYMLRLIARAVFALRCSESRIRIEGARDFAKEILPLIYYASFEQELEANLCGFIDSKLSKEREFKDNEIGGGKGRYIEIMSGEYDNYKIQPHTPKGE